MKRRRIAVVTGTRAEYGYLHPIIERLHRDRAVDLKLIVTGAHLEPRFGRTVREIEKDRLPIAARLKLPLNDDTRLGTALALAAATRVFARAFARLKPDLLVVLGDRTEVLAAASAALPLRIPVAHLHGGESSEGAWDESIRHAVTKLSHLHFPAWPLYAERLRRMGEDPGRVFAFGSPSLDRIRSLPPLSRGALDAALRLKASAPLGLVVYHPATLEPDGGLAGLNSIFAAVRRLGGSWVFLHPGADAGGRRFIAAVDRFVRSWRGGRAVAAASLPQRVYFSLLREANLMIGNSSSGIIEAPYFRLPVVNVGTRQQGRLRLGNVIDVPRPTPAAVENAARRALSAAFRSRLKRIEPPRASPSDRIVAVLREYPLEGLVLKRFRDG